MSQCPSCMYAFRPDDPRWANRQNKRNWVVTCPGCGGSVRFHDEDAPRSFAGWFVAVGIAAAIFIVYKLSS